MRRTVVLLLPVFFISAADAQLNWEGQTGGLMTPFAYTVSSRTVLAGLKLLFITWKLVQSWEMSSRPQSPCCRMYP